MTTTTSPAATRAATSAWRAGLLALGLLMTSASLADTWPRLYDSFAGNINFVGTQRTLRVGASDNCRSTDVIHTPTTATLSGLPAGATIEAAYLYWVGTGTPDYTVTFDGTSYTAPADRQYTSTTNTYLASGFSGAVDVTAAVAIRRNGTYTFSDLTLDLDNCTMALAAGWALVVIYSAPTEDFRVINVFEGFQVFEYSSITLTPNNFVIPTSPINGKIAHITWEGELGHSGNENLQFNGNILSDAVNPVGNQFNSRSTINGDNASYGVDFDVYNINAYLTPGMSSAPSVYSSGVDVVLLSAEIISVTNVPVADLGVELTRGADLIRGANANYTIDVTNNGPMSEAGPIVVTTTLSSQLSFVSAAGSGWSCSNAGLTVTCTRAGALGAGAAATPITLVANVSATASGIVTVSSTVDGALFDNVAANNTASDTFAFLPTAYAYYNLDESTWTGGILDSSGNGRNATVLGSATPNPYPLPVPPDAAISGSYGTCGAGRVPSTSGTQGIDTGIDVNAIGNTGTISFWYYASAAWNDGSNRMLFDASANFGNGNADKHFFLAKSSSGRLVFAVEDSNDREATATSSAYTFAAGQWHHITATWDLPNRLVRIYLDGNSTPVATGSPGTLAATLGNMNTLWFGDQRASNIAGTPTGYTSNSSNGYLDEIRIISGAVAGSDVPALATAGHACVAGPSLDHYAITISPAAQVACLPVAVTVAGHDSSDDPIAPGSTITLTTVTGNGTWTLVAGTGALNDSIADDGTATYSFGPGELSATFNLFHPTLTADSQIVNVDVSDGTHSEGSTEDPGITFSRAGLKLYNVTDGNAVIPVQLSGKRSTEGYNMKALALRALRQSDSNPGLCTGMLPNQTVAVEIGFECEYPNTCAGRRVGVGQDGNTFTMIATSDSNGAPGAPSYTSINMAFDVDSSAPIALWYVDAGLMRLNARLSLTSAPTPTWLTGESDFVVRPFGFDFTSIQDADGNSNPGGTAAAGARFVAAGVGFSATVAAYRWAQLQDNDNNGIPDAGVRLTGNGVTPNFRWDTTLTPVLDSPTGTDAVAGSFIIQGATPANVIPSAGFSAGAYAFDQTLSWSEVGSVQIRATATDYLGVSGVEIAGVSPAIGRFTPHHFALTSGTVTAADTTNNYTYMSQPALTISYTLEAQNALNQRTRNYSQSLGYAASLLAVPSLVAEESDGATNLGGRIVTTATPQWGPSGQLGIYPFSDTAAALSRAAAPDGPLASVQFGVSASADGASLAGLAMNPTSTGDCTVADDCTAALVGAATKFFYGRLAIQSANGSELLDLNVPMRAEYYSAAHEAFLLNTLDKTSTDIALTLTDASAGDGLNVDTETCVLDDGTAGLSGEGCVTGTPAPALTRYQEPPSTNGGSFNLWLRAPGAGNSGTAIVTATTLPAWLTYDWDDKPSTAETGPSGLAVFGIYKGSQRHIYLRELVN